MESKMNKKIDRENAEIATTPCKLTGIVLCKDCSLLDRCPYEMVESNMEASIIQALDDAFLYLSTHLPCPHCNSRDKWQIRNIDGDIECIHCGYVVT